MFQAGVLLGALLIATAVVIVIADSHDMSKKMPTQVAPRGLAKNPAAIGAVVLVLSLAGLMYQ
ncbi:MAG: hypothetical protein M3445_02445 [Actinomycetota bacterium]|nr:hypothetical protein [Actinomycetota bacterium]